MKHQNLSMAILILISTLGCSSQEQSRGYQLSGEATWKGQPIPLGMIIFSPDGAEGNAGPQCIAKIKDGKFETDGVKGHVGGPHRVDLFATDGIPAMIDGAMDEKGTALFTPYQTSLTLPSEDGTISIEVPAKHK
ncbi:hypothetical protein ACYFX5_01425 [Bremerella sp. T1]|uniref:hypothetical protein n=1 Tax=Bremerella sp. TYQ1 TaxID=3119568 RepID=UPI001CCBA05B|nr:hypothetical protein [Bremerella volcania]UBM36946.1 hypothetical protein LA756_03385 [Bremerella volcania]